MIIGIDPGKSGAMVALSNAGTIVDMIRNEATESDLWHWMKQQKQDAELEDDSVRIYLEKVGAMPKQGVSSTFKFGQSFGMLRGLCIASEIAFETVTPQTWQKSLGCRSGGDKNVTKAKAQELFPGTKITHKEADAILIAEYGRRLGL